MASTRPDLREERALQAAGAVRVAGLDEAGRGAWAGPVCAAAVVLPLEQPDLPAILAGVRDSKLLTPARRQALWATVRQAALGCGVGWATPVEIDEMGIVRATQTAMVRALGQLAGAVDALLIDYLSLPEVALPQRALPHADSRCLSVAAASIIAKVERDRLMEALDSDFPGYGFARHKGYGTQQHRQALLRWGATPLHRKSWRPLLDISAGRT